MITNLKENETTSFRFKFNKGINDCKLIEGYYPNDLFQLELGLDILSHHQDGKKTIVILSGLLQSDITTKLMCHQLEEMLVKNKVDHLIGIGTHINEHAEVFTMLDTSFYNQAVDLLQCDIYNIFNKSVIFVKDASDSQLRQIVMALQLQSQRVTLNVDSDAIIYNMEYFRTKLNKRTKMLIVLKASSIGVGDYELANILQYHDVDYFAVACTESVLFRKHGIKLPIMIFNTVVDSFHQIIKYNLEPTIYSLTSLSKLVEIVMQNKKCISIHLKLETGMNRLGIVEADLNTIINGHLKSCQYITVRSIFSHLAGQGSTVHDDYTLIQAEKIIKMARRIEKELDIAVIKHFV